MGAGVRTNIVIDDDLMQAAMKAGEFKTKRDAVEEGLRLVARRAAYQDIRALRGKLHWSVAGDWAALSKRRPVIAAEPRAAQRTRPIGKGKA